MSNSLRVIEGISLTIAHTHTHTTLFTTAWQIQNIDNSVIIEKKNIHRVSKKLCISVSVRTSSDSMNFNKFW